MSGGRFLTALGAVFLAAFAFQRSHSPFLRIEREAPLAQSLAARARLRVEEVMALRESIGIEVVGAELERAVDGFASERARWGDELAALAMVGERALAERLFTDAAGDLDRAHVALRSLPEAIHAVRFLAMRDRFADRREP